MTVVSSGRIAVGSGLRASFMAPLPELEVAADLLSQSADALIAGDRVLAGRLMRQADNRALYSYAARIMGPMDPEVHRYMPISRPARTVVKVTLRMPPEDIQRTMYARDGWRCRFCGCRIVQDRAKRFMQKCLPDAIPWSKEAGFHGALYALSGSVDHVVPHSAGGTNDLENLVTACWPCQFGRNSWLLEEVGLIDPRTRPPIVDSWDGLNRVVSVRKKRQATPITLAGNCNSLEIETVAETPKIAERTEPHSQGHSAWLAGLDASLGTPSSHLVKILDGCQDLGVRWSINKVMLARMKVGLACVEFFGIQPNGSVEIPWFIGPDKAAFRPFAEVLARAIPGAICYETPKTWTVSKANKRRLSVLELLSAASAIRPALEEMHSALRRQNHHLCKSEAHKSGADDKEIDGK